MIHYFVLLAVLVSSAVVASPVKNKQISSPYGYRESTDSFHGGVDYAVPIGTLVYSTSSGIVEYVGTQNGYGKVVIIRSGDKQYIYAHLSSFSKIRPGTQVKKGQLIAKSGNTGLSTGPHLHYEVRVNGIAVNPVK